MTAYKKWMIILIILMLSLTSVVIWTIQERFFKQDLLTIHESAQKIEDLYGGSVESFEERGPTFYMQLDRKGVTYNIRVDGHSGDLIDITKVKTEPKDTSTLKTIEEVRSLLMSQNKGEIGSIKLEENHETPQYVVEASSNKTQKTIIVNAKTGEIISEKVKETDVPPPPPTIISKERATQIALSQLSGKVISITFHETNEGGYYLVRIVSSKMDATFQIHAISGKVLSVTQNQRTDDDDDDDDDNNQDDDSDDDEQDDD